MTHKIKVDYKLKLGECCVCLENFPRQMLVPCTTCKYSSCKTCVEKMTIHDTNDDNYPTWEEDCHWNHTYKINCPMCRQPMVYRILRLNLQSKLYNWAYQYMTRSSLDWELDLARDGLSQCSDEYINKVELETVKDWMLSQTPLMKRWLNNYLSDPDMVADYLKEIHDGSKWSCSTPTAEIIMEHFSVDSKK